MILTIFFSLCVYCQSSQFHIFSTKLLQFTLLVSNFQNSYLVAYRLFLYTYFFLNTERIMFLEKKILNQGKQRGETKINLSSQNSGISSDNSLYNSDMCMLFIKMKKYSIHIHFFLLINHIQQYLYFNKYLLIFCILDHHIKYSFTIYFLLHAWHYYKKTYFLVLHNYLLHSLIFV